MNLHSPSLAFAPDESLIEADYSVAFSFCAFLLRRMGLMEAALSPFNREAINNLLTMHGELDLFANYDYSIDLKRLGSSAGLAEIYGLSYEYLCQPWVEKILLTVHCHGPKEIKNYSFDLELRPSNWNPLLAAASPIKLHFKLIFSEEIETLKIVNGWLAVSDDGVWTEDLLMGYLIQQMKEETVTQLPWQDALLKN